MGNLLDEVTGSVNDQGRDVHVIDRQLPVKIGFGSTLFEIALWITIPVLVLLYVLIMGATLENALLVGIVGCLAGILPGVIFIFMKISARNYFLQLEQRIQAEASNIDNYLEQRVQILQNVVGLVERAIDLDKDVMKAVAALRGGCRECGKPERSEPTSRPCIRPFIPTSGSFPGIESAQCDSRRHATKQLPAKGDYCRTHRLQQSCHPMEHRYFCLADKDDCGCTTRLHDTYSFHSICRDTCHGKKQVLLRYSSG